MLCIGLLVDVIYTAVVFFIDDFVTTAVLWLVIGTICVGELNQDRYRNYCAMKVVDQSCQLDIAYNVMTHSCGTSPNDKPNCRELHNKKPLSNSNIILLFLQSSTSTCGRWCCHTSYSWKSRTIAVNTAEHLTGDKLNCLLYIKNTYMEIKN